MKIYQIHKSGGEWEDRYDIIVGSYLNFNKAKEEKERLQTEEHMRILKAQKCDKCPLYYTYEKITDMMVENAKEYCQEYLSTESRCCDNYEFDMDESFFDVREVEVIE